MTQRIWIQEQLHPKIFEIFSSQAELRPLQHDACPTFAMEKWKARVRNHRTDKVVQRGIEDEIVGKAKPSS